MPMEIQRLKSKSVNLIPKHFSHITLLLFFIHITVYSFDFTVNRNGSTLASRQKSIDLMSATMQEKSVYIFRRYRYSGMVNESSFWGAIKETYSALLKISYKVKYVKDSGQLFQIQESFQKRNFPCSHCHILVCQK